MTQACFTEEGRERMIAAPEDCVEALDRLIAQAGGKLIAHYLTTGDYDIVLLFQAPSYEATAPALVAAAAGSDVADMSTVSVLTASEMKRAFVNARAVLADHRSAAAPVADRSSTEPDIYRPAIDPQRAAREEQADAKAAAQLLEARRKAMDDIAAGRPAPYYFTAPPTADASQAAPAPSAGNDAAKEKAPRKEVPADPDSAAGENKRGR
ncbi:MAG: GYD domain-containing protein [Xanthobacteraceae bacterium]